MAWVYLAHDDMLDRDMALRVLRERYDDEDFVKRFRRETRNAASLNHSGVVQIYDQDRGEDGIYYIAMEHVPGGTLKERIAEGRPPDPYEAAGIASQVADALAVAHGRRIVHRDVKPQNVLLTDKGEAKVTDFGIARVISAKTMAETNPAVSEELDALTAKLLAKSPDDRYPGADELAMDLSRVRDGLPPLAARAGGGSRMVLVVRIFGAGALHQNSLLTQTLLTQNYEV